MWKKRWRKVHQAWLLSLLGASLSCTIFSKSTSNLFCSFFTNATVRRVRISLWQALQIKHMIHMLRNHTVCRTVSFHQKYLWHIIRGQTAFYNKSQVNMFATCKGLKGTKSNNTCQTGGFSSRISAHSITFSLMLEQKWIFFPFFKKKVCHFLLQKPMMRCCANRKTLQWVIHCVQHLIPFTWPWNWKPRLTNIIPSKDQNEWRVAFEVCEKDSQHNPESNARAKGESG